MKRFDSSNEQRRHTRIGYTGTASLSNDAGHWEGALFDISLKGALMERPADWPGQPGDRYVLTLSLGDDSQITMQVTLAHVSATRMGLHCDHIDLDSISHLRRLVELNLGDPDQLQRELGLLGQ
ncbi:MAG: PilZ domain-containing protein [Gammaproteobacteria bacterium]